MIAYLSVTWSQNHNIIYFLKCLVVGMMCVPWICLHYDPMSVVGSISSVTVTTLHPLSLIRQLLWYRNYRNCGTYRNHRKYWRLRRLDVIAISTGLKFKQLLLVWHFYIQPWVPQPWQNNITRSILSWPQLWNLYEYSGDSRSKFLSYYRPKRYHILSAVKGRFASVVSSPSKKRWTAT